MIKIAICDDDTNICSHLQKILLEYQNNHFMKFHISIFNSGNKFIKHLEFENNYDILFLDIEIGDLTGIDVGEYIRLKLNNRYMKIIYISSFEKYAMRLFDLKPTNFLIKPLNEEKVKEVLKDILYDLELRLNEFVFNFKSDIFRIKYQNIIYFETIKLSKNIKIVTIKDEYIFRETLSNLKDKLNENNFIKINKSILVNFYHIKAFKPKELKVILSNDEELFLSKNRIRQIKEVYFKLLDERFY